MGGRYEIRNPIEMEAVGVELKPKAERKRREPIGRNTKSTKKRFDYAVDQMLNSGLMYPYVEDFFRYVDGELTWEQYTEVAPT